MKETTHLERVNVAEAVLHVAVHDELGQTQDLTAQVEGVAEAGLLALFGGQSLQETKSLFEMSMTQKLLADYKEQIIMGQNKNV